jgi:magnesium chelatase family protein
LTVKPAIKSSFSTLDPSARPFRSPHCTISDAGLIGGAVPRPGGVSLGHNGVLFPDELPEFQRKLLELIHQPLEDVWRYYSQLSC